MTQLKPHQQRVIDEKSELDERLRKLNEFIDSSPVFDTLDQAEQDRLNEQAFHMENYSKVLGERIAAFEV